MHSAGPVFPELPIQEVPGKPPQSGLPVTSVDTDTTQSERDH